MATLHPALPAPSAGATGPATPRAAPRQDRPASPETGRRAPRLAAIAASLALISGGAYVAYDRLAPQPAAAAVTTADVVLGNITSTISATGSVATPAQAKVGSLSSGQLIELLVKVGDTVAAGQPLARIGDGSLRVALAQAQAGYDSAVAALQKALAGATPEEIAAAQAQLDAARISLAQTQAVPQGADMVAAQSQLAAARLQLQKLTNPSAADVAAAQAQVDAAGTKLQAVLNPRPEDIAAAQSQLTQARLQLESLQNPRAEDVRSAELALSTAQSSLDSLLNPRAEEVRSAELSLASAQASLNALLSPRAEDVAAAQAQLDQARTSLAQVTDQPQVTTQQIANAELAVKSAQVAYDKALADSSLVGKTGGPSTSVAADTAIQQALISLQTAQNDLGQLQQQAPSEWEVRNAQLAVGTAQANLNKLTSPSAADVQQAQSSVEQARAALEKLKTPSAYEVQQAQNAVAQAAAALDKAKTPSAYEVQQAQESVHQAQINLDKVLTPAAADVAAAQQVLVSAQVALDSLRNPDPRDVGAAQESVVQAQAGVDKLLSGNAFDVQSAQNAVTQAQIGLTQVRAGSASYDIASAQAAVNQAQASLDQATANLAGATLAAPISGAVAATGAAVGEQVGASTAVVTLVDMQQVRVDVAVDESSIARVKTGQQATITFEALSGQRIPGTVSVISPLPTTTNGVVTYSVQIALDAQRAQDAGVRAGMTATAAIVADSRQGVVLAPNRAIKTQGQNRTVQVLTAAGATESRQVTVGLTNDQNTEILSGLQAGDKVVITWTTTAAVSATGPGGVSGVALPGAGAAAVPRG